MNFIFIRHGQGCHNLLSPLYKAKLLRYNDVFDLSNENGKMPMIDPELSIEGVHNTIRNAKILKKELKKHGISNINIVLSSPLLRAMETAYYIKREFKNLDGKDTSTEGDGSLRSTFTDGDGNRPCSGDLRGIYVAPYLREIDESGTDPKSKSSRAIIDTVPAYAMKPLDIQKKYLMSEGILDQFNFDYLDLNLRKEPGNINDFINWFKNSIGNHIQKGVNLNILVVTHAGVLSHATNKGFPNNTGFIVNNKGEIQILDQKQFILGDQITKEKVCSLGNTPGEGRCSSICKLMD